MGPCTICGKKDRYRAYFKRLSAGGYFFRYRSIM
ncbi:MAG: primase-helicase zinc-binding domain-containing protein [Peptoniphilaceae bacterium]